MTRLLGDHPLRVAAKLVIFSLLVGCVLTWLDVTPGQLVDRAIWVAHDVWNAGLNGLGRFGGTIALGAMIVVPVFVISRLTAQRRG